MAEEQSYLTRVNLYIFLEIFWKYLMLSTERRGSSNRSLVTMFSSPLPGINRVLELPEVPTASSVDGCRHLQVKKHSINEAYDLRRGSDTYLCLPQ
jgi:hypothetical protein